MKYLKSHKVFENKPFDYTENNKPFYIIQDILLEFFDDNDISPLPNEDTVSSYEDYLSMGDPEPMAYGYYIESGGFDAANNKTEDEIKSFAVWNLNRERVAKLLEFITEQRDRIKESTGYHITSKVDEMDIDRFDVYINTISDSTYAKNTKEAKISDYTYKLKNINLKKVSEENEAEVYELIDKLLKLV